jgi:hypothetical protein
MAKLGQLLVARGWITVQQLTRALQNQSIVGGRLGTCLVEIDALTEDLLLKGLSEQLGVPAASIDDLRKIPEEVVSLLPDKLARRCRAVPFRLEGSRLDLAMLEPRNLACQDEIAFATGKRVKIHVSHELRILEALDVYYKEESPSRFSLLAERLNRARYFWEKNKEEESAESASTLAAPLTDLFGSQSLKLKPPPLLPEPPRLVRPPVIPRPVPASAAPAPAPVASVPAPAAAAAAAPRPAAAARPMTIPLTEAERAALGPQAEPVRPPAPAPAPAPAPVPVRPVAPAPAPAPPPAAPRPEPLPDLDTFEQVEAAFAAPQDRERVGQIILAFLAKNYRRAALFQVARDKVTPWMAQGDLDLTQFEKFSTGFDQPSVFLNLRQGTAFYVGPMPPMPVHRQLAAAWDGELPRDCVALPVRVKDRMVAVIYADGAKKGLSGIDLPQLQRLAAATADALQRCILHKKKSEAGA